MDMQHGVFLLKFFLIVWLPFAFSRECRPRNGRELAMLMNCDDVIECDELTIILSSPQKYELEKNITVTQSSAVTVIGNGATISCNKHASMILCSKVINISNITISACGTSLTFDRIQIAIAILISNSSKVTVDGITVKDSFGTGLYLNNCRGEITIKNSKFVNNSLKESNQIYGGGGIHIKQMQPLSSSATVTISWCNFTDNNASIGKFKLEKSPVYDRNQLFGRGGGLSIYLNTSCVEVTVSSCLFYNNTAHRGGALFAFLLQNSSNNSIGIRGSTFWENQCTTQEIPESIYSAGGALAVLFLAEDTLNKFIVSNCFFIKNVAYYGGGLSVGTEKNDAYHHLEKDSLFTIENSHFERNIARIGSAMDFFCYSIVQTSNCHCIMTPTIWNVNLTQNKGFYSYISHEKGRTFSTLHLQSLTAKFEGDTIIADNEASGIGLETAVMEICANASITLQNNSGRIGGGIMGLGESKIYLHSDTTLSLIANMASEQGGGMYIEEPDKFFNIYSYSCFIQYENLIKPSKWVVNVTFEGNRANGKDNAIFTSSVYPCVWPRKGNEVSLSEDIFSTFCEWKVFNFSGKNCTDLIETLPSNFTKEKYAIELYPHNRTKIKGFGVLDDLGHDVTNNSLFTTCLMNNTARVSTPEPDLNSVGLLITETNGTYQILVQTAYHRSVSTIVEVTVLECPMGYIRKNEGCICNLDPRQQATLHCNDTVLELNVFIGHCAGVPRPVDSGQLLYSKCPFTANYFQSTTPVSSNASQFNEKFCKQHGRTDFLCKNCSDNNHGIDIYSPYFKCIQCNDSSSYVRWIKAVSVVIGPQTLFFLIVVIFHVGITAPSMTGYIFFSHVLTLPLETLIIRSAWLLDLNTTRSSRILTDVLLDPYRVWSFDYPEIFQVQACLHGSLKIMHAIAFRYIHALYPIVLLAVTLLFIELHARNCKPVVYMWKPLCFLCVRFRRNWEIKTSVIDAFATVILLSYSKVINTSLNLLTRNFVFNYTGEHVETRLDYDTSVLYFKELDHIILASVAIVMLSTFGLIPPLLLMLYPNRLFFKLLTKLKLDRWHGLHMFVETFHGSFKNRTNGCPERRWFAGIYFIFRIIVFMVFAFTDDIVRLHLHLVFTYTAFLLLLIILRPYKRNFYTCLDASFLGILIVTNTSVVYCASQVQLSGLPIVVWRLTYAILWIPTVYLALYALHLVCARSRSRFIQRHCVSNVRRFKNTAIMYFASTTQVHERLLTSDNLSNSSCNINSDQPTHSSLDDFSMTPDRVDNPQRYNNMDWSNNFGTSCSVITVDREKDREELRSKEFQ